MVTILAFLTMLIDHIGFIFFPGDEIWRVIGRIAFPLFAWGIVRGYKFTKNRQNYAKRIFILAIISQIPLFFLGIDIYNVCFTLLFGLISLEIIETQKIKIYLKIIFIGILLYISQILAFDYGSYGILTIILLYLFWQQKLSILYFGILTFLYYCINYSTFDISFNIQLYAILSLVILYFTSIQKYDFKLNFYFKYGFYPAHLAILYVINILI